MPIGPLGDVPSGDQLPQATHAERHASGGADPLPNDSIARSMLADVPHIEVSRTGWSVPNTAFDEGITWVDNGISGVVDQRVLTFWFDTWDFFRIPSGGSGLYVISTYVSFVTNLSGGYRSAQINVYRDSQAETYTVGIGKTSYIANNVPEHCAASAVTWLEENDEVRIVPRHSNGSTLLITCKASMTWVGNHFSSVWSY